MRGRGYTRLALIALGATLLVPSTSLAHSHLRANDARGAVRVYERHEIKMGLETRFKVGRCERWSGSRLYCNVSSWDSTGWEMDAQDEATLRGRFVYVKLYGFAMRPYRVPLTKAHSN